jgi:glutamate/tyrosine decarboxylase-like PLP-dependent enzyme
VIFGFSIRQFCSPAVVDMNFDLTSDQRRKLGYQLIDHIDRWFASLPDRPVQVPDERRTFEPLRDALPELGGDAAPVLDDICRRMVDEGFHVPAANYFGLMNPTPTYIGVLAEVLVAALNPQLATMARSQLASKIEQETVRWIGERIWPSGDNRVGDDVSSPKSPRCGEAFEGTFTSGGNEANFSALAMALAHQFPASVEDGVATIGAQPVAYCSVEAHHSIDKSLGLLGIGRKALRRVTIDDQVRMKPDALADAIDRDLRAGRRPFCVVATAGTTNSGAVDDIEAITAVCERYQLWMHVDGAYGAAAVLSDRHRDLVRGIERADSVTIDPHKWLAQPFAAGVVLTRRPEALRQAFAVHTPYMPRVMRPGATAPPLDNFKISTQWSRRMNSLKLWLTLQVHGRRAYEEHFERQLHLARRFADWVRRSPHFDLFTDPALTIVNLRAKGRSEEQIAGRNAAIVQAVTADGNRWISETLVNGRSVIRVMVISYLTEQRHMDALAQALTTAATQIM